MGRHRCSAADLEGAEASDDTRTPFGISKKHLHLYLHIYIELDILSLLVMIVSMVMDRAALKGVESLVNTGTGLRIHIII